MERDLIEAAAGTPVPAADLLEEMIRWAREFLYLPLDQSGIRLWATELTPVQCRAIREHVKAGRLCYAIPVPDEYWLIEGTGLLEWLAKQERGEPPAEILDELSKGQRKVFKYLWERRSVAEDKFHFDFWPNRVEGGRVAADKAIKEINKTLDGSRYRIGRKCGRIVLWD